MHITAIVMMLLFSALSMEQGPTKVLAKQDSRELRAVQDQMIREMQHLEDNQREIKENQRDLKATHEKAQQELVPAMKALSREVAELNESFKSVAMTLDSAASATEATLIIAKKTDSLVDKGNILVSVLIGGAVIWFVKLSIGLTNQVFGLLRASSVGDRIGFLDRRKDDRARRSR